MIIDFHTHIFPDKIAQKTIDLLAQKANVSPSTNGSTAGLLQAMERGGADIAVNLPVLTNPLQFESVNRFAKETNERFAGADRQIISFAGIHPACEDIEGKMTWIRENGFRGVKLHPDYQETFITDAGYVRIMECARDLDLIVVTHAGVDAGYSGCPVRCAPSLAKELIQKVPYSKFVLAHYGGNELFGEVYDLLCDEDVYFDTSYVLRYIGEETFKKILSRHGEDRILFGSDTPWSDIRKDVEIIQSFALNQQTEEKIFCGNAKKLLGI